MNILKSLSLSTLFVISCYAGDAKFTLEDAEGKYNHHIKIIEDEAKICEELDNLKRAINKESVNATTKGMLYGLPVGSIVGGAAGLISYALMANDHASDRVITSVVLSGMGFFCGWIITVMSFEQSFLDNSPLHGRMTVLNRKLQAITDYRKNNIDPKTGKSIITNVNVNG